MKIYYDQEVDAAYLRLSEETPTGVVEVSEKVNLDLTDDGKIVGIAILNVSQNFPLQSLVTCEFEPKLMAGVSRLCKTEEGNPLCQCMCDSCSLRTSATPPAGDQSKKRGCNRRSRGLAQIGADKGNIISKSAHKR
ncbi:DUF2283 domain-containing protein [Desulfovermiculus halophilus]|jgi:uncharacterized protein YuzE|uniref:DUF2283 domain-containing protein n=1 Tax=Desulfovermiculus halophilus TaxID=339722 RepID=UPI0009FF3ABB|nr:DUF2283 domain-containing protein [Desulfovermiculus halophilus]